MQNKISSSHMVSNLDFVQYRGFLILSHQNCIAPFSCFFRLEKMKLENSKFSMFWDSGASRVNKRPITSFIRAPVVTKVDSLPLVLNNSAAPQYCFQLARWKNVFFWDKNDLKSGVRPIILIKYFSVVLWDLFDHRQALKLPGKLFW